MVNIIDALEVFTRISKPVFGFPPPGLVTRYPCGLFKVYPQLLGFGLNKAVNRPLSNNGIASRTDARTHESIKDIPAPHRLLVYKVSTFLIQNEHTLNGYFPKIRQLHPNY